MVNESLEGKFDCLLNPIKATDIIGLRVGEVFLMRDGALSGGEELQPRDVFN